MASHASIPEYSANLTLKERLQLRVKKNLAVDTSDFIFDIPVTMNQRVSFWINNFQSRGKNWFQQWLQKSTRYMPFIQKELKAAGLPQDLAYMVMIESGFEAAAKSHKDAVGPWQFIEATGKRYGLTVNHWLDERKDFHKSTLAAIRYIKDLYREFGSWYLVAASYNMGENGLRRQINKYMNRDFWALSRIGALPQETVDYVPKILAAMLISKSPSLYGFTDVAKLEPLSYDVVSAPAGTNLKDLADYLGVTYPSLTSLNTELNYASVPFDVKSHLIKVPKGAFAVASNFLNKNLRLSIGSITKENETR